MWSGLCVVLLQRTRDPAKPTDQRDVMTTERKHRRCLYNKNTNYFKEHESRESIETRRSPTDRREVMTTERKHRRCLISHE